MSMNDEMGFASPLGAPSLAPAREEPIVSVSELIDRVKGAVGHLIDHCWVTGEVSNFSVAVSGHVYFTLKDKGAKIRCVMFSTTAKAYPVNFEDGVQIEVRGTSSVYKTEGQLQIIVNEWRPAGMGEFLAAYLQLKAKLEKEGLFDPELKRPLPRFPRRVGVVSSKEAAGFRDVVDTIHRRYPWIEGQLFHAQVQGKEAPESIVYALERAGKSAVDVILLVRGGGSFEDLFCFNDERVVRAVRACPKPVIAGIGHRTDFVLAAHAADVEAATPTAAAELIGLSKDEWESQLRRTHGELTRLLLNTLNDFDQHCDRFDRLLGTPEALFSQKQTRMTQMASSLAQLYHRELTKADQTLVRVSSNLEREGDRALDSRRQSLEGVERQLWDLTQANVARHDERLLRMTDRVTNPNRYLEHFQTRVDQLQAQLDQTIGTLDAKAQPLTRYQERLELIAMDTLESKAERVESIEWRLPKMDKVVNDLSTRLTTLSGNLDLAMENQLRLTESKVSSLSHRYDGFMPWFDQVTKTVEMQAQALLALNPDRPLQMGYARIESENGVVTSLSEIAVGDALSIHLKDGSVQTRVEKKCEAGKEPV